MMSAIMLTRRKFLALSAAALPGIALAADDKHIPLGAQLYTVRQAAQADLPAALKQIRAIGYEEVELYWNVYRHPAETLRSMLKEAGLRAPSGHFNYEGFVAKVPYAQKLGVQWMVCPMLPKAQQNTLDGFHRAAQVFNRWGSLCKQHGMRFAFHNHNYEFQDFNGTTGYDVILKETDPDLVWLEMDTYWITQAGRDPVLMLNQLGKRVRLLHLKDRNANVPTSQELNDAASHFTEIGRGTLNMREILATAQRLGVEHYFVEQDESDKPFESLKISYDALRHILPA
jgi:sugar phosphate isomerase/epimerase